MLPLRIYAIDGIVPVVAPTAFVHPSAILIDDAARGLCEIEVKNRFAVGDRLELVHPAGNAEVVLEKLEKTDGSAIDVAPGNGHRVWAPLPATSVGAFVARFV